MPAAEVLPVFVGATLLIVVVPGPDMAFVVGAALGGGRRAGVLSALGMAGGMLVHTAAAALGLGALLHAVPGALLVIRLAGALYLAWLAVVTVRHRNSAVAQEPEDLPAVTLLRRALLTNLANPKVVLFFLAFLPQFVRPERGSPAVQLALLGALFLALGLLVDLAVGLAAGHVSTLLRRRGRLAGALPLASAAVFAVLAAVLAVEVVSAARAWS